LEAYAGYTQVGGIMTNRRIVKASLLHAVRKARFLRGDIIKEKATGKEFFVLLTPEDGYILESTGNPLYIVSPYSASVMGKLVMQASEVDGGRFELAVEV